MFGDVFHPFSHTCTQEKKRAKFGGREGGQEGDGEERERERGQNSSPLVL